MDPNLQEQLENLPSRTGIYKFYDANGKLLYIGKALNLKSRVSSYFRDVHFDRPHIIPMIPKIARIETIETENEIESLVLESALIRENQPRFNVMLKDDKSYAWLYISTHDEIPKISIVRSIKQNEYKRGRLFGPYPSGFAVKRVFKYLRRLYPFCTCKNPKEVCLYYHLGMCPGPHQGRITKEEYRKNIGEIIKFLEGKKKRYLDDLEEKMRYYAKNLEFEKAQELRDKVYDLQYLGQKIGYGIGDTEETYVQSRSEMFKHEADKLARELGLEKLERIECYDISNIQGKMAYGAMVVSINGQPDSSLYRSFKIKSIFESNDPAMHQEVMKRRVKYLSQLGGKLDDGSLTARPDLILIDGAKTQLNAVKDIIPKDIFLMGISKGRWMKRKGGRKKDEFWFVRDAEVEPIRISNKRVLINIRDEAHRFSITQHRKLRKFSQKKSVLDEIPGIGPKRRKLLIQKFGSVVEMKKVTLEQLTEVVGNKKTAELLLQKLKN